MQNLAKSTQFEIFIFIWQWLTINMWFIKVNICNFNNKLQKKSFKNSFIWKNDKGLKNIHNLFIE